MILHGSAFYSAKYGNCHEMIQFSRLVSRDVTFISIRKENTAFKFKMSGVQQSNWSRNEVWGALEGASQHSGAREGCLPPRSQLRCLSQSCHSLETAPVAGVPSLGRGTVVVVFTGRSQLSRSTRTTWTTLLIRLSSREGGPGLSPWAFPMDSREMNSEDR